MPLAAASLFSNFSKRIAFLAKETARSIATSSEEAGSLKADAYELYHCVCNKALCLSPNVGVARATPLRSAESVVKLSRVPYAIIVIPSSSSGLPLQFGDGSQYQRRQAWIRRPQSLRLVSMISILL